MTESETCPECGTTFDRDTDAAARNAVIGHMVSKVDDEHSGIGYEKARNLLDISEMQISESATDSGPDSVETPAGSETDGRAATDGGTGGLGLSGPPSTASSGDPSATTEATAAPDETVVEEEPEPDTLDCPDCGADTGSTAEELDPTKTYRCSECGAKVGVAR